MIEDRINMMGLWAVVMEMRGKNEAASTLHQDMDIAMIDFRTMMNAFIKAGKSHRPGHILKADDDITSVNSILLWSNPAKLLPISRDLEKSLKEIKAGDAIEVRIRSENNQRSLKLRFHYEPGFPE